MAARNASASTTVSTLYSLQTCLLSSKFPALLICSVSANLCAAFEKGTGFISVLLCINRTLAFCGAADQFFPEMFT